MKPGDIVCLKSGGPFMSVKFVDEIFIACSWFCDSFSMVHEAVFHRDQLEVQKEQPKLKIVKTD